MTIQSDAKSTSHASPKFAAYDDMSIYAIGDTPAEAVATARADADDPGAQFSTAEISERFAAWIDENGWDGTRRSFDVRRGKIIDTTDESEHI